MQFAPDAEVEAEAVHAETMEHAVKARGARARSDALKLNDARDFQSATRRMEREAALLYEIAEDYAPAGQEAETLRQETARVSSAMAASMKKQMVYDAYRARRSRRDQ